MNVYTSTELASKTKAICAATKRDGCSFITNNGKLDCMMIDLSVFETLNDAVRSYDKWMAQNQLERMWSRNAGSDITLQDISDEIEAVRQERREALES